MLLDCFIKVAIVSGHAFANLPLKVFGWQEFCKQWFDCGKVMHKQLSQAKLSLDFSLVIDPVYMQLSLFPSSFDAKRSRVTLNFKLFTSTDFSSDPFWSTIAITRIAILSCQWNTENQCKCNASHTGMITHGGQIDPLHSYNRIQ